MAERGPSPDEEAAGQREPASLNEPSESEGKDLGLFTQTFKTLSLRDTIPVPDDAAACSPRSQEFRGANALPMSPAELMDAISVNQCAGTH